MVQIELEGIRKKGIKDGTPCQYGRCECPDYESPAGALRNSWLATCTSCRHSETEHRLLTKHDKLREGNLEKAHGRACIGCDVACAGYEKPDPSVPLDNPLAKQCSNCKHTIDSHRLETTLDKMIKAKFSGCAGLQCHVQTERDEKQMTSLSISECDNTEIGLWFEPTNIDPDDDEGMVTLKICGCRGFRLDNLSRMCQRYYGLTPDIVIPFLDHTPCQRCSHTLSLHHLPDEQEKAVLEAKRKKDLTLSGVVSFNTADNLTSQEAIHGFLLPSNMAAQSLPQLALAKVDSNPESGFSISITLCPTLATDAQSTGEEAGGKKRKKMGQILKDVKQRIKRRKTNDGVVGSPEGESTPDDGTNSTSGDGGLPHKLLRSLTQQVKVQAEIQCGTSAPTALDFNALEVKRRKAVMLLATGNAQGSVAIHTVSTDGCLKLDKEGATHGPTAAVSKLALHTSQHILYAGHADGTVTVWTWDVVTQRMALVETRRDRKWRVTAMSVAMGRHYLAIGYQNGDVLLYEALGNKMTTSPRKKELQQSPQSSVGTSGSLRLINSCSIAYGAVTSLAWHPDKIIVAVGGEDDCVTVFYMHTSSSNKRTRGTILQFFSPKKHRKPNTFYQCAVLKGHKSFVSNVTFDPRGHFLLSTSWDGQILFWSAAEIDDIIKIGDDETTMESFAGFILGQNQRTQKSVGSQGGGCPFVPLWMGIQDEGVFTLLRSSSSKVHMVGYELPKKILCHA